MPSLASFVSRGRQWILMPYYFGQIFTAAKSFEANPVIGSARTQCSGPAQDAGGCGEQTRRGAPRKAGEIRFRRGPKGIRARWICGSAQFSAELRFRTVACSDKRAPLHIRGETVGRYNQQKVHRRSCRYVKNSSFDRGVEYARLAQPDIIRRRLFVASAGVYSNSLPSRRRGRPSDQAPCRHIPFNDQSVALSHRCS